MVYCLETTKFLAVNKTAIDKYGYSLEEFLEMTISQLHPLEEQLELEEHLDDVSKGIFETKEWHHVTKDGQLMLVKADASSIEYEGLKSRLVTVEDVTQIKKIERERRINERKYKDLVETASDIIYRCSEKGYFKYVNPKAMYLSEYSEEELLGMHFINIVRDDYREFVISFYENQIESKTLTTYLEFPVVTKSNKEFWIGQKCDLDLLDNGEVEIIALARDITDRKRVQDELSRSEEKYRNIMENMELGLLEVNNEDVITKVYPKFLDLTGYTEDELLGKVAVDALLSSDAKSIMQHQNLKRKKGEPDVYELELLCKDGSKKWVIISGAPYYGSDGEIAGSIGIHLNITDRKKMESVARKMETNEL